MRSSHLLAGLASLLALTLAAPTPGNMTTASIADITTTDASLELGKVKLCNGFRQQGTCVEVNAHLQCQMVPSPVAYNVRSFVQSQGNLCVYSQGKWCDNNAFSVDSGKSEQVADVSPKWSPVLTGVICIPNNSAEAGSDKAPSPLQADSPIGPTIANRAESSTVTTPHHLTPLASPPGNALLCAPDINKGPCFKIAANSQCTDIVAGVDRHVRPIYQNKGSVCE